MTSYTVRDFLVEFLADELDVPPQRINDDANLIADLGFDSLSFAVSVAEIKRRFSIVLTKEDIFECKFFGDLVQLVEQRRIAVEKWDVALAAGNDIGDRGLTLEAGGQLSAVGNESESL